MCQNATVIESNEYKIPTTLYKYRVWDDEKHRRILTQNEIHFAKPLDFSDHHEMSLGFDYPNHPLSFFISHVKKYSPSFRFERNKRVLNNEAFLLRQKYLDYRVRRDVENTLRVELNKMDAIFCASEFPNNQHLWQAFAKSGSGFCVGFDTTVLFETTTILGGGGKVNYYDEDKIPKIKSMYCDDKERQANFYKLIFLLPKKYLPENEYRLIKSQLTNRDIVIKKQAIKEVILGEFTSKEHTLEIIDSVKTNLPHIKIIKRAKYIDYLGYYTFEDEVIL